MESYSNPRFAISIATHRPFIALIPLFRFISSNRSSRTTNRVPRKKSEVRHG